MAVLVAWAQPALSAADAGAARSAPARAAAPQNTDPGPRSRFFPKLIENPAVLSERVRARLEERARMRALSEGATAGSPAEAPPSLPLQAEPPAGAIERVDRRNGTPLRRMVSFENDEGVTVLSNRLKDIPAEAVPAPSARVGSEVAEPPPEPVENEATEVRPLRPKPIARGSRAPESSSAWPWFLIGGTALAGLATWWLRRSRGSLAHSESNRQ